MNENTKVQIVSLRIVRESEVEYEATQLNSSRVVAKFMQKLIGDKCKECLAVVAVDTQGIAVAIEIVAIGSNRQTPISLADVVRLPLLSNAVAVFIAHNHPSGCLTPSDNDKKFHKAVRQALNMFDITLVDNLIVSDNDYYSFVEMSDM